MRGADLELLVRLAAVNEMGDELDAVMPLLDECSYRIPFDSMNLQDGIDFAVLCIRTTIDVQRLTLGPLATPPSSRGRAWAARSRSPPSPPRAAFAWVQRTAVQGERPAGLAEGQV